MHPKLTIFFFLVIFISFCTFSCTETPVISNTDENPIPEIPDNRIRFLFTSTLESRFESFSVGSESFPRGKDWEKKVGGLARLMTVLEMKRAEGIPSITISNGNDVGGEIFEYFYGVATMQILNAMKYDVICPGISEFSKGEVILAAALRDTDFDIVVSNAIFENRGIKRKIQSHVIKEIGGFKVGFFGLIDPKLKENAKLSENSSVIEQVQKISETEVLQLQSEGAEIICAISNLDNETDTEIAKNVAGINIIFNSAEVSEKIKIVTKNNENADETAKAWETMIVNCNKFGEQLGVLDLTLEKTEGAAKILAKTFQNLPITVAIPENAEINKKVNEFLAIMPAD